jgi:tRNA threonylcarbamoyl adenosine modification protein YeaZ
MLLAIDSATASCSAALIGPDGTLIDERYENVGRGHAERLVPMIAELLDGRIPSAILVDCGPGSFTGVRVGLAAAHGLAIGWKIPLSGYSSMAAIAATCGESEVGVALVGGHGELFVQSWRHDPLEPLDDLASLAPSQAAEAIRAELVAGSGAQALIAARGYGRALDVLPRAADVRVLPQELTRLPAKPIYGRAPDAKPMA